MEVMEILDDPHRGRFVSQRERAWPMQTRLVGNDRDRSETTRRSRRERNRRTVEPIAPFS
jgi:hypothetical protein